jgi:inosose dehydratase
MASHISRRNFISNVGLAVGSLSLPSCFGPKNTTGYIAPNMKIGYASITWGGNDAQAIKDIGGLGYKGIQMRANIVKDYEAKPNALRALLSQYKLDFPIFSSGNANINTGNDEAVIHTHVQNAKFVKALGCSNIQVTNSLRPKSGEPSIEDLKKFGAFLNEVGKRTLNVGVQVNYHNHMGQFGQTPEEVKIILDNCEDRYVKFLLDIAHYHQGGGEPVKALNEYKDRIDFVHLKDVRSNPVGEAKPYTFVELGQGTVNLPRFFNALDNVKFKGWGIVELDAVPDKDKTPLQCAAISKAYLQSLKVKI